MSLSRPTFEKAAYIKSPGLCPQGTDSGQSTVCSNIPNVNIQMDPPPDMPRRPETWVSLCNLMWKLSCISRSSAILRSNSPQSNNRKGNSIHSPCERPIVIKHAIAGFLRLPRPTPAPALMRELHWLRC